VKRTARRIGVGAVGLALALALPSVAHARKLVFAETWENGTASWRTALNNGGDCKGWPTCPFTAGMCGPTFPAALKGNDIQVRDHDGEGNRDADTCSGKYVNIPRAYAGYDAGNIFVTGGVVQGGVAHKNAQFPVALNDRLCMVAWIRAYDEGGSEGGPYVGINYTGAHGVVDAGHNHCTHFVIGEMDSDPVVYCTWRGGRTGYGKMTRVIQDGAWHRYKAGFTVNASDLADWRLFSPELPAGTTWTNDGIVYGQPRLSLFGKPPERLDVLSTDGAPPIDHGADFGDVYVYKSDNAGEDPCPADAELDALPWASDHVACGANKTCVTSTVPLPAMARTPAYPANTVSQCYGCDASFGAGAPGPTVCPETVPFCVGSGTRGGTCTACSADAAAAGGAAETRCPAATPTCLADGPNAGACAACADDAECAGGGAIAHAGPSCNKGTGACFTCTANNGGMDPGACTADEPRCDAASGKCDKCQSNDDCNGSPVGPICDVASGRCGKCDGDADVSTSAFACSDPAMPNCRADGSCGRCGSAADCVNPAGVRLHSHAQCDVGNGACDQGPLAVVPHAGSLAGGVEDPTAGVGEGCSTTPSRHRPASPAPFALGLGLALAALARRRRR
jgi:uncharacterized protein (TIGR03382 family)